MFYLFSHLNMYFIVDANGAVRYSTFNFFDANNMYYALKRDGAQSLQYSPKARSQETIEQLQDECLNTPIDNIVKEVSTPSVQPQNNGSFASTPSVQPQEKELISASSDIVPNAASDFEVPLKSEMKVAQTVSAVAAQEETVKPIEMGEVTTSKETASALRNALAQEEKHNWDSVRGQNQGDFLAKLKIKGTKNQEISLSQDEVVKFLDNIVLFS